MFSSVDSITLKYFIILVNGIEGGKKERDFLLAEKWESIDKDHEEGEDHKKVTNNLYVSLEA